LQKKIKAKNRKKQYKKEKGPVLKLPWIRCNNWVWLLLNRVIWHLSYKSTCVHLFITEFGAYSNKLVLIFVFQHNVIGFLINSFKFSLWKIYMYIVHAIWSSNVNHKSWIHFFSQCLVEIKYTSDQLKWNFKTTIDY
jgi:hypothetical protein